MTETEIQHDSDCAQHNEPAYPNGPCDCSAFRPALSPPAEGASKNDYEAPETITSVDWQRVGPKLVEALRPFAVASETVIRKRGEVVVPVDNDTFPAGPLTWGDMRKAWAALAAAQPSAGAQGEVVAPIEIDHPHRPSMTVKERTYLAQNVKRWGLESALVDSLCTSAMANPGQGSFAGYLWAIAEQVKGLLAARATPAQPDTGDVAALREVAEFEADMERDLTESEVDAIERSLRTILAFDAVGHLRLVLFDTMTRQAAGYDWNADPDGMTLRQSAAIQQADRILAALSKPSEDWRESADANRPRR